MNRNLNYISLDVIANKILKNPILKDMNYEDIIDHALSVIKIAKVPGTYREESCVLSVVDHKAAIPKNALNIKNVGVVRGGSCKNLNVTPMMHSSSSLGSFTDELGDETVSKSNRHNNESSSTYKINNQIINTSFKTGEIFIVFDTIKVDEDGIPMVLDSEALLRAIEAYIKLQAYTVMADLGKISERALNRAEQEYYFNIAKYQSEQQGFVNEDHAESFINSNTRLFHTKSSHNNRYDSESEKRNTRIL